MTTFSDPYASNYRLLSRSYDTSHPIFKTPLKVSTIISQQPENTPDQQDRLSRDSSKGMIKLGAKIRNIRDDSKYQRNKLGNRIDQSVSQIFSEQMKHSINQSTIQKYQKQPSQSIKLAFKRIDSTDYASTKTDSPNVSTFLQSTNKFISAKLTPGESTKQYEFDMRRTNYESGQSVDKQRFQRILQQKSAQINNLARQLEEQKRIHQSKTRQLQLDIEMLKYTHQQTLSSFYSKVDNLKKDCSVKDNAIAQYLKQVKELKQHKNNQFTQIRNIKEESRRLVEEWKNKYSQAQADIKYTNIKHSLLLQQKSKLQSTIKTLNNKLLITSRSSDQNSKPYSSLPKRTSITMNTSQSPSNSPQSSRIVQISKKSIIVNRVQQKSKQQQISSLKKSIQSKNKTIYNLSQQKMKLEQKIQTLNNFIEINNQQIMKQRIEKLNQEYKYKYL